MSIFLRLRLPLNGSVCTWQLYFLLNSLAFRFQKWNGKLKVKAVGNRWRCFSRKLLFYFFSQAVCRKKSKLSDCEEMTWLQWLPGSSFSATTCHDDQFPPTFTFVLVSFSNRMSLSLMLVKIETLHLRIAIVTCCFGLHLVKDESGSWLRICSWATKQKGCVCCDFHTVKGIWHTQDIWISCVCHVVCLSLFSLLYDVLLMWYCLHSVTICNCLNKSRGLKEIIRWCPQLWQFSSTVCYGSSCYVNTLLDKNNR